MTKKEFIKEYEEHKPTKEDIIELAKKLGCPSNDFKLCVVFIKEMFYNKTPKNSVWN